MDTLHPVKVTTDDLFYKLLHQINDATAVEFSKLFLVSAAFNRTRYLQTPDRYLVSLLNILPSIVF